MSLFHLRELWSVNCGEGGNTEEFDKNSLCVCNVDNDTIGSDKIVTASFSGILRVYKLSFLSESHVDGENRNVSFDNHYQPSDLLLEVDFNEPILQVHSGILLASNNIQLAVLHPSRFCVYSISSTSGMTEHGTSYNVLLIYEHLFERKKAFNMMLGSFGQVKDKEIICIQNTSCQLNFYENESFSFSFSRNGNTSTVADETSVNFPMQLAYIPDQDLILLTYRLYTIECYRYQDLAMSNLDAGFKPDNRRGSVKLSALPTGSASTSNTATPEWTFSFGETVLDMQPVKLNIDQRWVIIVLGERNICALRQNGTIWYVKKFEANPSCLCAYANDQHDSVISIVGTHMYSILIYQNDSLKWATKCPIIPIAIQRGNFLGISGALVLLSDEGQLLVSYLGTNPSLKIISLPPTSADTSINANKMNEELKELKSIVNAYNMEGNKSLEQVENKLGCYFDLKLISLETIPQDSTMLAVIEFTILTTFKELIKISFYFDDFHTIEPKDSFLNPMVDQTTEDSKSHKLALNIKVDPLQLALSDKLHCCLMCADPNTPTMNRMMTKYVRLPFEQLVRRESNKASSSSSSSSVASHYSLKLSLERTFEDKASLSQLFEELAATSAIGNGKSESLSFYFVCTPTVMVTVHHSVDNVISYLIESNHISGLYRTLRELFARLRAKSIQCRAVGIVLSFHPVESLVATIEQRLCRRNILASLKTDLDKFSQHYRVLQKRILIKLKDKNPASLSHFEKLLKTIHSKINELLEQILNAQRDLRQCNCQVWSQLKLWRYLLKLAPSQQNKTKTEQFLKITSIKQMTDFGTNWEEQLESNLVEVLQLNRDINKLTKVINYEENSMRNCTTLRELFLLAYENYFDQSACPIQTP